MMKVALVNMPFNSAGFPSLSLGLLKAELTQAGIEARQYYLNLEFGKRIGFREYEELGMPRAPQLAEWLGSWSLFGDLHTEEELYELYPGVDDILKKVGLSRQDMHRMRTETVPQFLDWCVQSIPWESYGAVGFTSCYEQQLFSLSLAKRLKERFPHLQIIFGGANLFEAMGREHFRAWEWIDHVCLGEGDNCFPELIKRLEAGHLGEGVKGMLSRVNGRVLDGGQPPLVTDIDGLPDPDYEEYFETCSRLGYVYQDYYPGKYTALPFETARGCWWGAKHHCKFCGLPAQTMKFRSRSVPSALAQIERMAKRYGTWHFVAVDNIMEPRYIKELFGALAEQRLDYRFWYEAKANLTPEQLCILKNGGLEYFQPGIESLSSNILKIMDKGITALGNVNTIKWGHYYGFNVQWNILTGFPGETPEDYQKMRDLVPKLVHLRPPDFMGRIILNRFSPYFEFADRYPVRNQRPYAFYAHIYPEDRVALEKVAYNFEYEMDNTVSDDVIQPLRDVIADWQDRWARREFPDLFYMRALGRLEVVDTREVGKVRRYTVSGDNQAVLEFCQERPRRLRTILEFMSGGGVAADGLPMEVRAKTALRWLIDRGLVVEDDGDHLTIALPMHHNWENAQAAQQPQTAAKPVLAPV